MDLDLDLEEEAMPRGEQAESRRLPPTPSRSARSALQNISNQAPGGTVGAGGGKDVYRERVVDIAGQLRQLQERSHAVDLFDAEADVARASFEQKSSDMLAKLDTVLNMHMCA